MDTLEAFIAHNMSDSVDQFVGADLHGAFPHTLYFDDNSMDDMEWGSGDSDATHSTSSSSSPVSNYVAVDKQATAIQSITSGALDTSALDELQFIDVDVVDLALAMDFSGSSHSVCGGRAQAVTAFTPTAAPEPTPAPKRVSSAIHGAPEAAPARRPPARKLRTIRAAAAAPSRASVPATVSAASTAAVTAATTQLSDTQRATGRPRVKDEIESLRQYVARLETQLRVLCRTSERSSESVYSRRLEALPFAISSSSSSTASSSTSLQLWKRIARHQRSARRLSEAENARLRALLETQLKLAQSLSRAMRRQPSPLDIELPLSGSGLQCRRLLADPSEHGDAIYARLADALDAMHLETDAVLAAAGFSTASAAAAIATEGCASRVRTDVATSDAFLELASAVVVPFGLQATSAGFWTLLCNASGDTTTGATVGAQQSTAPASDTMKAQYKVARRLHGGTVVQHGHIRGKLVACGRDRVVFTWRSVGYCEGAVFGGHTRVPLHESGWSVLSALPGASPTTAIQNVWRVHPHAPSAAATSTSDVSASGRYRSDVTDRRVHAFADAMVESYAHSLETLNRATESAVLSALAVQ